MKIDKMGVVIIAAHLTITLVVIIGYIICLIKRIPAPQLETMAFMIMAYWFGAMGANKLGKITTVPDNPTDETKKGA
jgi:hypothetical protein